MKKSVLLVLALTLALCGLGVGYAAWNQTVDFTGTVNMGTLAATICLDSDGLESSAEYATIVEGDSTETCLSVTIDNAAAGNIFTVHYLVINSGSIPTTVTFAEPVISATGIGATSADITVSDLPVPTSIAFGESVMDSFTITINDSAPMSGIVQYSVAISIAVAPV